MSTQLKPRVYIICLTAYSFGIHHGAWVAIDKSKKFIERAIKKLLKTSPVQPAAEWKVIDTEDCESIGEYPSIETLAQFGQLTIEHGEVVGALLNYYGDLKTTIETLENYYFGEYDSEKDFAINYLDQSTEVPDFLKNYIDYERFADDIFINDFLSFEGQGGKVHVFQRH